MHRRRFFSQCLSRQLQRDRAAVQHGHPIDFRQGAFQYPRVTVKFACNEIYHLFRRFDAAQRRFLAHDGYPCFQVWLVDPRHQPLVEPAHQTLFQLRNLRRRAISRKNNLFTGLIQAVEGMKKLFL